MENEPLFARYSLKEGNMQNSLHERRNAALGLIAVALAGAIAVVASSGNFDLWDTIVGISLLLVLRAYSTMDWSITEAEKRAVSGVYALCWLLVVGFLITPITRLIGQNTEINVQMVGMAVARGSQEPEQFVDSFIGLVLWLAITCLIAAIITRKQRLAMSLRGG